MTAHSLTINTLPHARKLLSEIANLRITSGPWLAAISILPTHTRAFQNNNLGTFAPLVARRINSPITRNFYGKFAIGKLLRSAKVGAASALRLKSRRSPCTTNRAIGVEPRHDHLIYPTICATDSNDVTTDMIGPPRTTTIAMITAGQACRGYGPAGALPRWQCGCSTCPVLRPTLALAPPLPEGPLHPKLSPVTKCPIRTAD